MRRYLPLILYPVAPAVAGALMGTYPLVLAGLLVAAAAAWLWKARSRPALDVLVPSLPASGFRKPIAAMVVLGLLMQAVASFLGGMGSLAGWSVAWLLPYAVLPSLFLAGWLGLKRRLSKPVVEGFTSADR